MPTGTVDLAMLHLDIIETEDVWSFRTPGTLSNDRKEYPVAEPVMADSTQEQETLVEGHKLLTKVEAKVYQKPSVYFAADIENADVVVSTKDNDGDLRFPIAAEKFRAGIFQLFELGSVCFTAEEGDSSALLFRLNDTRGRGEQVNISWFRDDHPVTMERIIDYPLALHARGLAVGILTGNFMAKPKKDDGKDKKSKKDE